MGRLWSPPMAFRRTSENGRRIRLGACPKQWYQVRFSEQTWVKKGFVRWNVGGYRTHLAIVGASAGVVVVSIGGGVEVDLVGLTLVPVTATP